MDTDGMMISSVMKIHSREEILQALRVIKDVCSQHDDCESCPFQVRDRFGDEGCKIQNDNDDPSEWNIKDNDDNWKAFN